jgi:hypothetical protein
VAEVSFTHFTHELRAWVKSDSQSNFEYAPPFPHQPAGSFRGGFPAAALLFQ